MIEPQREDIVHFNDVFSNRIGGKLRALESYYALGKLVLNGREWKRKSKLSLVFLIQLE